MGLFSVLVVVRNLVPYLQLSFMTGTCPDCLLFIPVDSLLDPDSVTIGFKGVPIDWFRRTVENVLTWSKAARMLRMGPFLLLR